MSGTIVEHVDVQVPVDVAYDQWTQFEQFPQFMTGVRKVEQLDDRQLRWTADIAGETRTWRAEITEQEPDQRIAWRAMGDVHHAGVVTFHHLTDRTCRVTLQMEFESDRLLDKLGHFLGADEARVLADLREFKRFIELRGMPTGSWRGRIDRETGEVTPDPNRGPRDFGHVLTVPAEAGERRALGSPPFLDRRTPIEEPLVPEGLGLFPPAP